MKRGALVLAVVLAAQAGAQDIDRSQRPATPPPPTFKFPKVTSHTLPNGLRLLVAEDHSLPLVAVRAVIDVDSTMDPPGKEGLYALSMSAMREGTTTQSPDQLAERFADIGTTVTPTSFTTTSANLATGLALMGDMLMHPALDEAGVERRKALQAAFVRRQSQSGAWAPRHLFYATLYGATDGYVRSLVPSEASINAVTRDDIVHFHDAYVRPQLTTVIVSGDMSDAAAVAAVTHVFSAWEGGSGGAPAVQESSVPARPTTIYLLDTPNAQSYVYVGDAGPTRSSPDFAAADLMGAVVSNRMTETLRERHGFMYSGASGVTPRRVPLSSTFVGSAIIPTPKVDSALTEWLGMLRGVRGETPVTPQELEVARNSRIGLLPARTEGPDSVANRIAELVRENTPLDYYDRYVSRATALTPGDVVEAAKKYVDVDHLVIVVTGDRKVLEPALRAANLGPVVEGSGSSGGKGP